jgi:hypothetical protein
MIMTVLKRAQPCNHGQCDDDFDEECAGPPGPYPCHKVFIWNEAKAPVGLGDHGNPKIARRSDGTRHEGVVWCGAAWCGPWLSDDGFQCDLHSQLGQTRIAARIKISHSATPSST